MMLGQDVKFYEVFILAKRFQDVAEPAIYCLHICLHFDLLLGCLLTGKIKSSIVLALTTDTFINLINKI